MIDMHKSMTIKEKYPGVIAFLKCLGITKKDSILILSDGIADCRALNLIGKVLSQESAKVEIKYLPNELQADFPTSIKNIVEDFDAIILAASQSWYQAPTRKWAKKKLKKRIVEFYNPSLVLLENGALCADYIQVAGRTELLSNYFKPGSLLELSTGKGTKFSAIIKKTFTETGLYHKPGSGGNLPAGEISIGIFEQSAKGDIVFDLSMDELGRLERSPLMVAVKNGRVVNAEGDLSGDFLKLLTHEERLSNIAEIGFGTNDYSILGRSVLEDEKLWGTAHIGFGNDTYFEGYVGGPHYDGVFSNVTIKIENRVLMESGVLLDDFKGAQSN